MRYLICNVRFATLFILLTINVLIGCHALAADDSVGKKEFKNTISISVCNFSFPKLEPFEFTINRNLFNQFGFYYNRNLTSHIGISLGYSQWNTVLDKDGTPGGPFAPGNFASFDVGTFEFRRKYKMIDVFFFYNLSICRNNDLSFLFGVSRYWGYNTYIDNVYYNPDPPYDAIIYSKTKLEYFFGVVPGMSYNHLFFHKRMGIGADVKARKYFNLFSAQIDYGLHLAVNF